MDSNAAHFSREDDKECQLVPAAAAEEPSRPQGSAPQAAAAKPALGAIVTPRGQSSHQSHYCRLSRVPASAAGSTGLNGPALVDWSDGGTVRFARQSDFEDAKLQCQETSKSYVEVVRAGLRAVRVRSHSA